MAYRVWSSPIWSQNPMPSSTCRWPRNSPLRRPRPEQNRGYIAPGEERLARLRGDETPPDLKELYTIGPFDLPDTPYFTGPAAYPSFAPNLWPARPVGLRPALEGYWRGVDPGG